MLNFDPAVAVINQRQYNSEIYILWCFWLVLFVERAYFVRSLSVSEPLVHLGILAATCSKIKYLTVKH